MGILTEDMRRVVDTELGFVATTCADGTPNLSPKGTIAVWDDDHLVFADLRSPGTIENLQRNPTVEVNVVDQLVRKGYRFKGTGRVYTDGATFERGIEFYEARAMARRASASMGSSSSTSNEQSRSRLRPTTSAPRRTSCAATYLRRLTAPPTGPLDS